MKQGNLIGTDQTTLTDRIKDYRENNPDYNPREHILSDDLVETKLRREYNFPKKEYSLYDLLIATVASPFTIGWAAVVGAATTYYMHKEQIDLIINYYLK